MKVLVTGAEGFLGARLVERLRRYGVPVIGAARRPTASSERCDVTYVHFDLSDDGEQFLEQLKDVDALVHLAWSSTPSTSNKQPTSDLLLNVGGTVRLFEMCVKAGVKRIVFASTGGQVYGDVYGDSIDESSPTNPKSAYGIGKLSCEKYLSLFCSLHGISGASLRVANIFGPGQPAREGFGVIPTFLGRIQNNDPIMIFGDGLNVRDFVYIDDVVEAFFLAIYSGKNDVYNIASGVGVSILEVVNTLEKATGLTAQLNYQPARASDPLSVVLANHKAMAELGWTPKVGFSEGLLQTVRFNKENSELQL